MYSACNKSRSTVTTSKSIELQKTKSLCGEIAHSCICRVPNHSRRESGAFWMIMGNEAGLA